jgi:hypothetical protein
MPVTIEVTASVVDLLVANGWLIEAESGDAHQVAKAIEQMLADAAN